MNVSFGPARNFARSLLSSVLFVILFFPVVYLVYLVMEDVSESIHFCLVRLRPSRGAVRTLPN